MSETEKEKTEKAEADLKQLVLCKVWSDHLDGVNAMGIRGRIKPPPTTHSMLSMAYGIARWVMHLHEKRHHTDKERGEPKEKGAKQEAH